MKNSSDTIGNRTRDLPACRTFHISGQIFTSVMAVNDVCTAKPSDVLITSVYYVTQCDVAILLKLRA
jgi:hypothetical protein